MGNEMLKYTQKHLMTHFLLAGKPCIKLYQWKDAPEDWQEILSRGGDEDWVVWIPKEATDLYWPLDFSLDGWYSVQLEDGDIIAVHTHS